MHPAILPAALSFCAALAMASYVATRREKAELHWLLLAVLGTVLVWTSGIIFRFSVETQDGLEASLRLIFLGVFATPPLWLLLAACYAGVRVLNNSRGAQVAVLLPSACAYLALLTNDGHHLVMREVSFEALRSGDTAWAGPAFWAFVAWAYVCIAAGVAIYLGTAGRMVANAERRRAVVLALAALVPAATSTIYLLRLFPIGFDPTPASLIVSLALTSWAVFRYQLLESLPLARRDVIESLHDGVIMASATGVVLDLNPAAERILERSSAEVRRQSMADVLAALAPEEEREAVRRGLSQLRCGAPYTVDLETVDGRCVHIEVARARDAHGGAGGHYAVLRDRTEESRYERIMRQVQRFETVGTLAAGIAHEVNNPLAFIRANLSQIHLMGEIVEQHASDGETKLPEDLVDLRQIAEETLDGIGRIERIVGDMRRLATSREEQFVSVDVNAVVRDAVRLANLGRDPSVSVKMRLMADLPPVEGSAERLVQALLNLLVNARHALSGRKKPRISVSTDREDGAVLVRVSDNGPGIGPDLQERIFDPFFTTKGPDKGTGLGLSIAFDIVRDHGGVIDVLSRPGEGAAFVARLPLRGVAGARASS